MKKENKAVIEMLACATLWSMAGIFIKLIPWNGFVVAGLRSLIAGATIALYMLFTRRQFILNRATLTAGIIAGCVYTCFTVANKLTTAANAIVLQFTSPVFIVIFSALIYRQRIRKNDMFVVLTTLFGIALFFFDQLKPGYILGNVVAIVSGMFMAGMYVSVGNLEGNDRFSAILVGQLFSFLVGVPFMITTPPIFTLRATACIFILGVFQLGLSYILYIRATRYCPPLACCLLGALEPLLNPVWVFLFDGERPGIFALIGAVIVVVSITAWCIFGQKQTEQTKCEAT